MTDEPGQAGKGTVVTFYSYKGGTGRSMALANMAWILASNGFRVLAVDWDLESPGLHRYFHPFLPGLGTYPGVVDMVWDFASAAMVEDDDGADDWVEEHARIMRYAASLDHEFEGGGLLDFVPAGQTGPAYGVRVSELDWKVLYDRQGGGAFVEKLREDMRGNYDYVLIDSRTGLSDTAGICTVALPDVLVNCFTLSSQSVDGAVTVARSMREQRKRDIRVVPVPMRVEDSETTKLEAGRDYARSRFAEFLAEIDHGARERFWGEVEIPYKAFYAYEEILATIGDRPHQENTLLAAYERLAKVLTNGAVTELVPMPEHDRRRRLAEFERTKMLIPSDVFVSHAEQDRMWAEWIAHELQRAGFSVVTQGSDFPPGADVRAEIDRAVQAAGCTIVVLTPDHVDSPHARVAWEAASARDPLGDLGLLLPVRVSQFRPFGVFASRVSIDLVGLTAEQAREELLAAMEAPSGSPREVEVSGPAPRFPGEEPTVFQLPPRNPVFVGRDSLMLQVRAHLANRSTAAVVPQALHGLGGVGKSQLALEYAYRFGADYDLVWWVNAEQVVEARAGMTELAPHLGIPPRDDAAESLRAVLDALRRGEPYKRWLLVFDNAGNPEDLQPLLPSGPGHVLITSRNQDWAEVGDTVEVDVLDRDESIELVGRRGRGISRLDADRLAERLGDLPLALELATAWQAETGMPVGEYLELLEEQMDVLLSDEDARLGVPPVTASWRIAFAGLVANAPVALQLLELCAFFGSEPIPFRLLALAPSAPSLPADLQATLADSIQRRRAVREIGRYALARIDPSRDTLEVHRLVQDLLRDGLSDDERETFRSAAHELLAAANPGSPDNPETWPLHAELSPHVVPSGAIDGRSSEVRDVVLDQARYRYRRGDLEGSRGLAKLAWTRWADTLGLDDEQTLRMCQHLADVTWWLGEFTEALELRLEAFERMRRILGEDHALTLAMANTRGGDLRVEGHFANALAHDQDYLERHRRVFGDDDPNTLRSSNNLAADLRLLGDFRRALEVDEDTLGRRRRSLTEGDGEILSSLGSVARDLIGLGDYVHAVDLLDGPLEEFARNLGPTHFLVLQASRTFAIALRKAGRYEESRAFVEEALRLHLDRFGPVNLNTLAVMTSACNDRRSAGDLAGARELGEQAMAGYEQILGADHPFTDASRTNLAIVLRAVSELASARELAERAYVGLERSMGADNVFTLCCAGNLVNDLAAAGDHAGARRLSEEVADRSRVVRGDRHPDTLGCYLNLAADLAATGVVDEALVLQQGTVSDLTEVLGDDHPAVRAADEGARVEFDIELPDT